jgi:hypothetical protein
VCRTLPTLIVYRGTLPAAKTTKKLFALKHGKLDLVGWAKKSTFEFATFRAFWMSHLAGNNFRIPTQFSDSKTDQNSLS